MKKQVVLFLVITAISCLHADNDDDGFHNSVLEGQIKEIQGSKIGQAILKMAELNYKLQGPVDELIETIKGFGRQLIERVEQENLDFEAIKAESSTKIKQLQSIVNDAEVEQSKQKKKIVQEFEPRKADIESALLRLKTDKSENANQLKMQEALRNQQKLNYENSIKEIGELIRIDEETLKFVGTLLPRQDASLIEMDKIQLNKDEFKELNRRLKNIKGRVESQAGKGLEQFVETLLQLTDQQSFKQRHFIKSIVDLLNKLKKGLVEVQNKLSEDDHQQQRAYDQWLNAQDGENSVYDSEYQDLIDEREDMQSFIADCENIIKIHESDISLYGERIRLEQSAFLLSKQTHEELTRQINNELDIIQKAIKLLYSPAIFEYLKYKMNILP